MSDEMMDEDVFPSMGNTCLIRGNCLVNLCVALKHVQKDKNNVEKNIMNLIDFDDIILKHYRLKDCDKCQEFTKIDMFVLCLNMMDSKIVHDFLLAHAKEDCETCFKRDKECTNWFEFAGKNLKGE